MWSSTKACGDADAGTRQRSGIADPSQLVAEPSSVVGGDSVERLLQRQATDVDQAAEHVGRESGALLVGEERNA